MSNIAIPLLCVGCICLGLAIRHFYNRWKAAKVVTAPKRPKWENFGKPKRKK
jgi:hypothetical protein